MSAIPVLASMVVSVSKTLMEDLYVYVQELMKATSARHQSVGILVYLYCLICCFVYKVPVSMTHVSCIIICLHNMKMFSLLGELLSFRCATVASSV